MYFNKNMYDDFITLQLSATLKWRIYITKFIFLYFYSITQSGYVFYKIFVACLELQINKHKLYKLRVRRSF